MKLKTLKDIEKIKGFKYSDYIIDELKAEAVKKAKYYIEKMDTSKRNDYWYFKGKYDEVMEMNNLTEQDIQEQTKVSNQDVGSVINSRDKTAPDSNSKKGKGYIHDLRRN